MLVFSPFPFVLGLLLDLALNSLNGEKSDCNVWITIVEAVRRIILFNAGEGRESAVSLKPSATIFVTTVSMCRCWRHCQRLTYRGWKSAVKSHFAKQLGINFNETNCRARVCAAVCPGKGAK